MEQALTTVLPEEMWSVIRNMGRAVQKLGDWSLPEFDELGKSMLLVLWRWSDFVEMLEEWTGPNDVQGVERWPYDETEEVVDEVERWLVGLKSGEFTPEALRTRLARHTARTSALTALLDWREAHPDEGV